VSNQPAELVDHNLLRTLSRGSDFAALNARVLDQ